jgi:2-haloacid dehalogenase
MEEMRTIDTVIFDLGGVLIDWHPDHLYRKLLPDERERIAFYRDVCTADWNEEQDAGRPLAEATGILVRQFPEKEELIRAYYGRWEEMLNGPFEGTVEALREIRDAGKHKLYALTNWSAETFPVALERYEFLNWFDGRVVSGEEKTRKPFLRMYEILIERFGINPSTSVYIDDNARNLKPAADLGMATIHFHDPVQFRKELGKLGVP